MLHFKFNNFGHPIHRLSAHMLPKMGDSGSKKNLEWKIVETNEDGRIHYHDCTQTFSTTTQRCAYEG